MGKNNGNRFTSFRRFLRNVPAFFHRQYLRLVCLVGLSLLSSVCLGDFTGADSTSLRGIETDVDLLLSNSNVVRGYISNIETDMGVTHEKLNAIYRSIGITGSGDSSVIDWLDFIARQYGYGVGSSQNGNIAQDFDTLINGQNTLLTQTDTIETLLQSILDALESQDTGGSGSGSTSINQDWVKETTFQKYSDNFQNYSDNFQTYYDWMKASFGFDEANSSPYDSPASFVDLFLKERYILPFQYWKFNDEEAVGAAKVPFPGSPYTWVNEYPDWTTNMNSTRLALTFSQLFTYPIMTQLSEGTIQDVKLFKKAAWNDWQAHTNLVENLRLYLSPNDLPTYNYDSNTGNVTLRDESATGSYEEEVIDTRPVSTNSVDTAVVAITNSTESVETFFNKEEVQQRYISSSLISVGQNYVTDSSASSASGAWAFGGYTIWDEAAIFQKYREMLTVSKLEEIRAVMEYLWLLVSILASIYLVKRWANME